MKRFLLLLFCATALILSGCSKDDDGGTGPDTETTDPGNEYTFVKNITGYWGSGKAAVRSAFLKLYTKGNVYYVKAGVKSETYAVCSKNSKYKSSYTGRDPMYKYKYYAKVYTITYYFDI